MPQKIPLSSLYYSSEQVQKINTIGITYCHLTKSCQLRLIYLYCLCNIGHNINLNKFNFYNVSTSSIYSDSTVLCFAFLEPAYISYFKNLHSSWPLKTIYFFVACNPMCLAASRFAVIIQALWPP